VPRRPDRTGPSRVASPSSDRLRVGVAISGYARVTDSVGAMARPTSLEIVSELVANVLTIEVAEGDRVEAGDTVVLLESMKMEIPMLAERAGTVTAIKVTEGDVVQDGDVLVVLD
jgi:acetyl-CoA carboxylase biotin carboxyl carrier protein